MIFCFCHGNIVLKWYYNMVQLHKTISETIWLRYKLMYIYICPNWKRKTSFLTKTEGWQNITTRYFFRSRYQKLNTKKCNVLNNYQKNKKKLQTLWSNTVREIEHFIIIAKSLYFPGVGRKKKFTKKWKYSTQF